MCPVAAPSIPSLQEAHKRRYVFFSFPHIAINSKGVIGALSRRGQHTTSSACGALIAALGQLKAEGLDDNVLEPGRESPRTTQCVLCACVLPGICYVCEVFLLTLL